MGKGTTVFYHSIYNSVEVLTDNTARIDTAIGAVIRYAVKGEEYTGEDPIVKCAMLQAIPLIEADRAKTNKGGHGAPKGNQNAKKQTIGQEETNHRLEKNKPMVRKKQTYAEDGDGRRETVDGRRETKTVDTGEANASVKKNIQKEKFIPPTLDEVKSYMSEYIEKQKQEGKYLSIGEDDPERFIAHHSASGWIMSNRKPMKDWKGAVRTWILNHNKWNKNYYEERKKTLLQDDSTLGRFNKLLLRKFPFVVGHMDSLLTANELDNLLRIYTHDQIISTLCRLEDRQDYTRKHTNLMLTICEWIDKQQEDGTV